MAAPKKPAKLATDTKAAVGMSARVCEHCSEPIPADKVQTVIRDTCVGLKSTRRKHYYLKGHELLVTKAAA